MTTAFHNRIVIVATPREQDLYEALLKTPTEWLSREDLAERTEKPHLSVHDHRLLERMEAKGLIQSSVRKGKGLGKYFYRALVEEN